jgi:hypothetical protein
MAAADLRKDRRLIFIVSLRASCAQLHPPLPEASISKWIGLRRVVGVKSAQESQKTTWRDLLVVHPVNYMPHQAMGRRETKAHRTAPIGIRVELFGALSDNEFIQREPP